MMEIWKPVVGYEGLYEVSSEGKVKSVSRTDSGGRQRGGHLLQSTVRRDGYVDVYLFKDGVGKRIKVHTLVNTAFNGPKPTNDLQCRHRDGDRQNNHHLNLSWGTALENAADKILHGRTAKGEKNGGGGKLTEDRVREIKRDIAAGISAQALASKHLVSIGMIRHIAKGRSWGYV